MKKVLTIGCCLLLVFGGNSQYYLRGEVRDEKSSQLSHVRIYQHKTGYVYYSGNSGEFGIPVKNQSDSFTFSSEGYLTQTLYLSAATYQTVVLPNKLIGAQAHQNKLSSLTKNFRDQDRARWSVGGESYSFLVENPFVDAATFPETGFSMNTDKASYSNIRRFLNLGSPVPPDAVRLEEVLNYFNFDYSEPPRDSVFSFHSTLTECPWDTASRLLLLKVNARKIDPASIPPSNLVFLVDVSGSMDMPNRLPLLKSGFKMLVDNLREQDTVSIVIYGSSAGVWMGPTSGADKKAIRKAIEELTTGGATSGESGIRTAYRLAKSLYIKNGNNRVVLATDGDFNVGQQTEDELDLLVTQHQKLGIYLTCLGVGMGNYKDSKLEILAKKGNGNFSYLDNESEAQKVLVKELTQTLYSVADDAYLNINFNPALVKEYRLLGYDNKGKAMADSLSVVEGGEVGSGHTQIAIFQVKPQLGLSAGLIEKNNAIAQVWVDYKLPGDSLTRRTAFNATPAYQSWSQLEQSSRLAVTLGVFTGLLKESEYLKKMDWTTIQNMANQSVDMTDPIQSEFLQILLKAKKIYSRMGRRKKN